MASSNISSTTIMLLAVCCMAILPQCLSLTARQRQVEGNTDLDFGLGIQDSSRGSKRIEIIFPPVLPPVLPSVQPDDCEYLGQTRCCEKTRIELYNCPSGLETEEVYCKCQRRDCKHPYRYTNSKGDDCYAQQDEKLDNLADKFYDQ